jgi:type I restriction enzyme, S subunit
MAIDNKDKKVLNVPPLRFPEFSGEWKKCTIGELAIKVGSGVTPRGGESCAE